MYDRTVLVTGGAGGLGRSVVAALVEDGWRVVVPVEAGSDLQAGGNVTTGVADPTDPHHVGPAPPAPTRGPRPRPRRRAAAEGRREPRRRLRGRPARRDDAAGGLRAPLPPEP